MLCRLRSLELRGNAIGDGTTPTPLAAVRNPASDHPTTCSALGSFLRTMFARRETVWTRSKAQRRTTRALLWFVVQHTAHAHNTPACLLLPAGGASALAEALLGERRRGALEVRFLIRFKFDLNSILIRF